MFCCLLCCTPGSQLITPASPSCQELERLRGELLALRERAGELGAIRDQLAQVTELHVFVREAVHACCQQGATCMGQRRHMPLPVLIAHSPLLAPLQEHRLTESLQQRLAGSQQALLEARQDAATRCGVAG